MNVTVAVLAAGSGRRFGAPKLLMPAGEGEVLLSRAVSLGLSVGERVLCVLPSGADLHVAALEGLPRDRLVLLSNPDAAQGMGTSVAMAASACLSRGAAGEALLILPADLPTLDRRYLLRLIEAFAAGDGCDAAAALDPEGRLLAPAILRPGLLPEIAQLRGDAGARDILRRPGSRVVPVAIQDMSDIDDFDGYRHLAHRLGWDREPSPKIAWRADAEALPSPNGHWRVGATLAVSVTGHGPGISGMRMVAMPQGLRRALFAGDGTRDRLGLLRAAALLSLRDENC